MGLPEGWTRAYLGQVADMFSGATPSRKRPDYYGGDIPWVKSGEVNDVYVSQTAESITQEGLASSSARIASQGSTLVAMYGATAGKVAQLRIDAAVNQAIQVISPHPAVLRDDFVFWAVRSLGPRLLRSAQGSGQSNLSGKIIRKTEVPLPPLGEQRKIAAILSSVDEAIEKTQAVIEQVQVVKRGLMQELLTKGLPGRHKRFKQTGIGEIPADWEVVELDKLIERDRPICYGILKPGRGYLGGVPVIKVKNIKGGVIQDSNLLLTSPEIDESYRRSRLRKGDVLLSIRGTTGRVAVVPPHLESANITQDTARIGIKSSRVQDFVFVALQGPYLQKQISDWTIGQAVKGINIGRVRKLLVGLPKDCGEREAIVEVIAGADERRKSNDKNLMALQTLKKSLMSVLLTGELRVTPSP